jgi:ribosomal protein S18 acetylase RimI-like enzyme
MAAGDGQGIELIGARTRMGDFAMAERAAPDLEALVRPARLNDLPSIEPLWYALYKHQKEHGMFLEVSPNSFKEWAASMKAALGRFSCLFVVELHAQIIGFLGGRIGTLPPYFGGFPFGFISEVFVSEKHRSRAIGRELMAKAVEWFCERGVNRIELQVLLNNTGARRFYNGLGWSEELIQMVWNMPVK